MRPLISVVTVCYNSEKTIRKTIESVLSQDLDELEYLIIDGESTDNTISIVREYESQFFGKLRIVSEKDNGWYDAMNKGIRLAEGQFINFLNSDDYFDHYAIRYVCDHIKENQLDTNVIVYGDSTNVYRNSTGSIFHRRIEAPKRITVDNKDLVNGMCNIRHQSMFTGRQVFETVGLLNLKYRLHADWDFMVKCLKQNIMFSYVKQNLTFYSMYGASTKPNAAERHMLRRDNGLYKYFDVNYFKDRFGMKILLKRVLGESRWNDVLFFMHTRKKEG